MPFLRPATRPVLRRAASKFLTSNLEPGEISIVAEGDGYLVASPRENVRLLSISTPRESWRGCELPGLGIPVGGETAAFDYVLRFKYPHFDPSIRPRIPWVVRPLCTKLVHGQHLNTFHVFSPSDAARLAEKFALRPGENVLEAGPYMGFGTVKMSRRLGASGRILSLEPIPRNFHALSRNLEANAVRNVTPLECALGAADGENRIFRTMDQSNSLVAGVVPGEAGGSTPVCRIDTICRRHAITPTFMVLTTNGAELEALQASREFIAGLPGLRIIAPGWYADAQGKTGPRIVGLLKGLGFEVLATPGQLVFAYRR